MGRKTKLETWMVRTAKELRAEGYSYRQIAHSLEGRIVDKGLKPVRLSHMAIKRALDREKKFKYRYEFLTHLAKRIKKLRRNKQKVDVFISAYKHLSKTWKIKVEGVKI